MLNKQDTNLKDALEWKRFKKDFQTYLVILIPENNKMLTFTKVKYIDFVREYYLNIIVEKYSFLRFMEASLWHSREHNIQYPHYFMFIARTVVGIEAKNALSNLQNNTTRVNLLYQFTVDNCN